jgi:hypothetical protein
MGARGGDLERPPSPLLPADVGEIRDLRRLERACRHGIEPRRVDLAPKVRDDLAEVLDWNRLHARERDLSG